MKTDVKIPWKFILGLFLILRLLSLVAAWVGLLKLPFKASFPYWDAVLSQFGHPLLWSWANFDGVHYIMLARDGYAFGLTQAFFPGYFLLMRLVNLIFNNYLLSGLLISHVSFILMLALFYKILRLDYGEIISRRALIFISLFPTSFYFLSLYTESLFLLLLLAVFYWVRTMDLTKVGFAGVGLTLSRIVGIFVIPSLIMELKNINKRIKIKQLFWILVPALGLLGYMLYLSLRFDDPILFAHVQKDFGAGRETAKLVLLYQVIWRYLKMIFTVERQNPIYFTLWLELLSSLYALSLLVWGYISKIRPSYLLFSFLAFLLPTLTGTFSSMPRYVLVLFPIFIKLAQIKNTYLRYALLTVHIILLFICTLLFTRGYWIA